MQVAEVVDKPKEQKKSAKQWAVQVDLTDSSADEFHNKIPKDKMAHKVCFVCVYVCAYVLCSEERAQAHTVMYGIFVFCYLVEF